MKQYGMHVTVRTETAEDVALPENQAVLLFQSTRELLMNAAKHAVAKEATVTMALEDRMLRITVRDEGVGFDPSAKSFSKFGLFSCVFRLLRRRISEYLTI